MERFAYRAVSEADTEEDVNEARAVMRLVVGLRRKLDAWTVKEEGQASEP